MCDQQATSKGNSHYKQTMLPGPFHNQLAAYRVEPPVAADGKTTAATGKKHNLDDDQKYILEELGETGHTPPCSQPKTR